jgi:hypothetical protein
LVLEAQVLVLVWEESEAVAALELEEELEHQILLGRMAVNECRTHFHWWRSSSNHSHPRCCPKSS